MPAPGDDEQEKARLFYVGVTRATQRLVITVSGMGGLGNGLILRILLFRRCTKYVDNTIKSDYIRIRTIWNNTGTTEIL